MAAEHGTTALEESMSGPNKLLNVTQSPPTGDCGAPLPVPAQVETRSSRKRTLAAELNILQHQSFNYFLYETNPANGLVIDKTEANWPASIAAAGLALASYPVAVERGFMPRAAAVERALTTLRFFWNSPGKRHP